MLADPVLRALTAACPGSRPASPGDAVAGGTPRFAASPASVAEASAVLRAAAEHDLAVVPRGSGSKLGWGVPPRRCDLVVDTLRLDQVLEHAAGDLVARVQAGVGLHRLAEVLGGAGQELALDPAPGLGAPDGVVPGGAGVDGAGVDGAGPGGPGAHPEGGTVGGTLATGAAGPRRLRYGTPRDLVIGITVIRADGTVAHSGGKVVKNVAGYDLGKLFAGSFGTLGLIVEAVFRLHPRPATAAYVTIECADASRSAPGGRGRVGQRPGALGYRDRPASPGPADHRRGAAGGRTRRGRRAGRADGRAARRRRAAQPSQPAWWGWPGSDPAGPAGTLVRVAFWAAALPRVFAVIDGAARSVGLDPAVGGSAAAGVIYVAAGPGPHPAAVAAFVSALRAALARGEADARPAPAAVKGEWSGTGRWAGGGVPPVLASAVVVHAPPAVRDQVDLWGPVPALPLMRAVKDQFDPGHRMAPGRFAGGI